MPRQFKNARLMKNLKATEAAEQLGVSQPTLSAWEGERKSPSIEGLEKMADFYEVSTDYLLGRTLQENRALSEPISLQALPVYHGRPVWSREHGWMLVNSILKILVSSDGQGISFSDCGELFLYPVPFCESLVPGGVPLKLDEINEFDKLWVEPVSPDSDLKNELRGWYHVKELFVVNEFGNRFYLDTYGAKWLAFSDILPD